MSRVKGDKRTPEANKVIKAARAEVGYKEGRNNSNKFAAIAGHLNGYAWCATFIEAVTNTAGLRHLIPDNTQSMAGCDQLFQHFQKKGRWSQYPAVGALGFCGQSGSGSVINGKRVDLYHVFLVEAYDDDYVYTLEGNTNDNGSANGDGVYQRRRARRNSTVECYAYPEYKEGILNADPNLKALLPKESKPAVKKPAEPNVNAAKVALRKARKSANRRGRKERRAAIQSAINILNNLPK